MLNNKFLNITTLILILGLPALVFYACDDHADGAHGETMFVNAYLRYTEENIQVKGELQFLKGDSVMTAEAFYPTFARMQGHNMRQLTTMQSARYSFSFHNQYQTPYRFDFAGPEREEYRIDLAMQPIANKAAADTIPADRNWVYAWDGDALTDNENLTFLFISPDGGELTLNVIGPTSQSKFQFSESQFETFDEETATLHVIKRKIQTKKEGNMEARIRTEFYLREIPVVFQ